MKKKKTKPSEAAKQLAKEFDEAGCYSTIYLDSYGDPVFASAWYKDIIVSKIIPPDDKLRGQSKDVIIIDDKSEWKNK